MWRRGARKDGFGSASDFFELALGVSPDEDLVFDDFVTGLGFEIEADFDATWGVRLDRGEGGGGILADGVL